MGRVGVEHFHIELLADFPCERREQLLAEEGRHIRLNNMVVEGQNTKLAGTRTRTELNAKAREFYTANRENQIARGKAYKAAHKEELKEKVKAYQDANREVINAKALAKYHSKKSQAKTTGSQAQAPPGTD